MSNTRTSLFNSQQSEDLIHESKRFYDYQTKYIQKHNIKNNPRQYINHDFLQRIVVVYQKMIKHNKRTNKGNSFNKAINTNIFLFGKAIDILIRQNITDKSFINYNDITKGDFYNNAVFRVNKYTINTYKEDKQSAFVYFTSTIRNAFKEELNAQNKLKMCTKATQLEGGLNSSITNMNTEILNELDKDYIQEHNIKVKENNPMFINKVIEKYGALKNLEISLNTDGPRFLIQKLNFSNYLPITKDKGVVIKYIDIFDTNEDKGQSKLALQNEIKTIRENGYQTFYIFSDLYLNKDRDDSVLFNKLDVLIENIKKESKEHKGTNLMFDYIPTEYFDKYNLEAPIWYYLNPKREERKILEESKTGIKLVDTLVNKVKDVIKDKINDVVDFKRELVINQDVKFYIELKDKEPKCSRVFDAGVIDLYSKKPQEED